MDPRNEQLARMLVEYSIRVKPGDKVLIQAVGGRTYPLVEDIITQVYQKGGKPFLKLEDTRLTRALLLGAEEDQYEVMGNNERALMEQMDCWVGVRGAENALETSDVPMERMKIMSAKIMQKVHFEVRVPKTRWVILRYPSPTFAQSAKMSTPAFEDFYYAACLVDYPAMSAAMDPLVALMNRTDKVRIEGPGTDLRFSIKDIPAIKCAGQMNVPDGEVFTAPVKDSVEGVLSYNTPTLYEGNYFDGITLTFEKGKAVKATCRVGDAAKLNAILDRDEGSRYVGEFALGCNPVVQEPMLDILFDEKIAGSFHFTPGASYDEAPNGNQSQVHWDMVCRQFEKHGGGAIYFDGVLVRKDGLFTLPELTALNP